MSPQQLLAFEQRSLRHDGAKEERIRRELSLTPARYYMLLNRAARTEEGMRFDPVTARIVRGRNR